MVTFKPEDFLNLSHCEHRTIFDGLEFVWQALERIAPYLKGRIEPAMRGEVHGTAYLGEAVFVGEGTLIEHGAVIKGPTIIGKNCQIRAGAYIRENVILGDSVVAGNSCELKNSIVFDNAEIPHFNYVGDSILGYKAHLGAGVILSNVRLDRRNVCVTIPGREILPTGLRKFGAIIGDHAEIGCNSVLSPGSIIGRHSLVYPCTAWNGLLPESHIAKSRGTMSIVPRRNISA